MSETIRAMFLVLMFAGITTLQFNMDADKTTSRQLQNTLEIATHDAALALDETRLAQGEMVFDQEQARYNIQQSIIANMDVDRTTEVYEWGAVFLKEENSFYQSSLVLYEPIFIDDSNTNSFPFLYENKEYGIREWLYGPAIVLSASIQSPRYFAGNGRYLRKTVIYEYFQ